MLHATRVSHLIHGSVNVSKNDCPDYQKKEELLEI